MGALDIVEGVTSGLSTMTGMYSAVQGAEYNDRALAMQREENALNRDFQSQEAQKERDFAQAQTNTLLDYNSAPAQVQRLRGAGVNPSTAFSNSAGSAGAAMSPTRGAIPAGSAGLSIPQFVSPIAEMSASGAWLKSLAEAYKTSEEGSKARELMESEIAKNFAEHDLKELQAAGQRTANEIVLKTGLRKAEADIKMTLNRADLDLALKAESIAKKGLTEAQTNREIEQLVGDVYDNVYKQFRAKLTKKDFEKAEIDLRFHKSLVEETIKNLQSSTKKNLSESADASAHAKLLGFQNKIWDAVYADDEVTEATRKNLLKLLDSQNWINEREKENAARFIEALEGVRSNKAMRLLDNYITVLGVRLGLSGTASASAARKIID